MSRFDVPTALLLGLALGLLVGATLAGPLGAVGDGPGPDPENPLTSYATAGPGCFDGTPENTGWLHVVANGQSWGVTLNATVVHPRGTELDANVSRWATGEYEVAIRSVEPTATATPRPLPEGCRAETSLDLATGLATPEFVVTVNGRTVASVDQDETYANLYPLQNPLNVTG